MSFAAGVYAATADIAQTLLASLGIHVGWVWLGLAGAALDLDLAFLSIGFSSLVILACEGAAVALITAVAVAVLASGGYHHHGLGAAPFSTHGASLWVPALGVTAVFGQLSGFESAATLGEEARHSTRIIPAAIAWSLAGAAAVYIFFTWIVYSAYPDPAAVAAAPAPLVSVAGTYLSSGIDIAVNAAGMVSAFGGHRPCRPATVTGQRHSPRSACSTTSVSAGWMYRTLRASWSTVVPRHMAWVSGCMRVDACGPMRWAPSSSRVAGSASTFTKLVTSSSAQP